ncbi:MAG: ParB N-terminal domain-containing protein [Candidatus Peribacteraceae bacterium]|nr:ParB N-terminal domain-containing protein [Candidatus Peribacteraceae bacterium]
MEVVLLKPQDIKVKEGVERYRRDMGGLKELADSIKRTRQILPIVINKENELIDGGRRLAACVIAGLEVKCVYEDCADPYEMRELEVEANLHRKDFSPAEYALAVRDLHEMKIKKYGEGGAGRKTEDDTTWDAQKTAKIIGKTKTSVYRALEMADLIDKFPQLKSAKTKSEITKAAKGLVKLEKTVAGLAKHKETITNGNKLYEVVLGDSLEHMLIMPNNCVDILLTDPLYGIEADKLMQSVAGTTGGKFSTAGYKIDDSTDKAMLYYKFLAKESYRFTATDAHGYVFVGPEYFWTLREIFIAEGWRVHVKPLIWIKREVGQCNVPHAWPSSCYEMMMYMRKDDSCLIQEGKPDWFECLPVLSSERRHVYEKPVKLIQMMLERISLPGHLVYDPFCGSGPVIEVATRMKLRSVGIDISAEAYANTLERLSIMEKEGEKKDDSV